MHPAIKAILERPRVKTMTLEWFRDRSSMITGSQLAAILGQDKYCSRKMMFRRKTHQKPPPKSNMAMNWGIQNEDKAAKAYVEATGEQLVEEDIGLVRHPEFPFIGASPDRLLINKPICVEIKCPFSRKIEHKIPDVYYPQVQLQMCVLGLDMCHFVQFKPANGTKPQELDILEVPYDPFFMKHAMHEIMNFHNEVQLYLLENEVDNSRIEEDLQAIYQQQKDSQQQVANRASEFILVRKHPPQQLSPTSAKRQCINTCQPSEDAATIIVSSSSTVSGECFSSVLEACKSPDLDICPPLESADPDPDPASEPGPEAGAPIVVFASSSSSLLLSESSSLETFPAAAPSELPSSDFSSDRENSVANK